MKADKETWVQSNGVIHITRLGAGGQDFRGEEIGVMTATDIHEVPHSIARAKLAAAAPEMARLLLHLGLGGGGDPYSGDEPTCASCGKPSSVELKDCAPSCSIARRLRAAGVIP